MPCACATLLPSLLLLLLLPRLGALAALCLRASTGIGIGIRVRVGVGGICSGHAGHDGKSSIARPAVGLQEDFQLLRPKCVGVLEVAHACMPRVEPVCALATPLPLPLALAPVARVGHRG